VVLHASSGKPKPADVGKKAIAAYVLNPLTGVQVDTPMSSGNTHMPLSTGKLYSYPDSPALTAGALAGMVVVMVVVLVVNVVVVDVSSAVMFRGCGVE
jgi:hypothetical protein